MPVSGKKICSVLAAHTDHRILFSVSLNETTSMPLTAREQAPPLM
jgi:hypothetical protein